MAVDSFQQLFYVIRALRWPIIVVWFILAGAALYPAMHLISTTSQKYEPPKSTPAYAALEAWKKYFPENSKRGLTAILITRQTNSSVLTNFTEELTYALRDAIVPSCGAPEGMVNGVLGYYTLIKNYSALADSFVTPDHTAAVVLIPVFEFDQAESWADKLSTKTADWVCTHQPVINSTFQSDYVVEVTGLSNLLHDSIAGTTNDLAHMDSIALPLALIVLTVVLRSLPLMIIPILNVVVSFSLSFGVMYFVAKYIISVASFCPPVMVSVILAMSFDYCLFLLSRWREELEARRIPRRKAETSAIFFCPFTIKSDINDECVSISLRNSGKIILTSGCVLLACFLGMIALPLTFVQSFGLAASIALIFTIIVNLTLTPALLLVFRALFTLEGFIPGIDFNALFCRSKCCKSKGAEEAEGKSSFSFFRWLGKSMSKLPHGFIATFFVLVISVSLSYFAQEISTTPNIMYMMPHNSPSIKAIRHMLSTSFPPGISEPYEMIVVPKSTASTGINGSYVWTKEFFDSTYQCIQSLCSNVSGLNEGNVVGIVELSGQPITFDFAMKLMDPKSGWGKSDMGIAYRQVVKYIVSNTSESSFVMLMTSTNPLENSTEFLSAVRSVIDNCTATMNYTFMLTGDLVSMEDAISKVMKMFPLMAVIMSTIIMVFLLVVYRTAILPIRTILTITVTLGASFGCATMLFVKGWLINWIGLSFMSDYNSFFWFSPICVFTVIVGLSLDYDLFLFTRIFENRSKGLDTKESVALAVEKAGKVIMFAGLIMAIAFGGLIFSSIVAVTQIGFMLCFSVLFDTLFVHTLLVPSVVSMLRNLNWFPRNFPTRYTSMTATSLSPEASIYENERASLIAHGRVNYTEPSANQ